MNLHWSHIGLNCHDQKTTENFYTRHFGFTRARTVKIDDTTEVIFLRNGNAYLELFPTPTQTPTTNTNDGPQNPGTIRHLAFQTDNIDTILNNLGPEADITLGPLEFNEYICGWRTAWIRDPDGTIIEISQGYTDENPHT
jgi:glyoxylase I family protein